MRGLRGRSGQKTYEEHKTAKQQRERSPSSGRRDPKEEGETLRGRLSGEWLALAEEPGYVLIRAGGRALLQRVEASQEGEWRSRQASGWTEDRQASGWTEDSGQEPPPDAWQVVFPGQVRVRSDFSPQAGSLATKAEGDVVRGRRDGNWLVLLDEPGVMMIETSNQVALLREISGASAAQQSFAPQGEWAEEGYEGADAEGYQGGHAEAGGSDGRLPSFGGLGAFGHAPAGFAPIFAEPHFARQTSAESAISDADSLLGGPSFGGPLKPARTATTDWGGGQGEAWQADQEAWAGAEDRSAWAAQDWPAADRLAWAGQEDFKRDLSAARQQQDESYARVRELQAQLAQMHGKASAEIQDPRLVFCSEADSRLSYLRKDELH